MLALASARAATVDDAPSVAVAAVLPVLADAETLVGVDAGRGAAGNDSSGGVLPLELSHLLPESVQDVLPRLFEKYGHPEELVDDETSDFIHRLLPGADFVHSNDEPPALGAIEASSAKEPEVPALIEARAAGVVLAGVEAEAQRPSTVPVESASVAGAAEEALVARRRAHDEELAASRRAHEEIVQRSRDRAEKSAQRRAAMQERHAHMGEHVAELLKQVHEQLELDAEAGGAEEAALFDGVLRNATPGEHWELLSLNALMPALQAVALRSDHRVLVLQPPGASPRPAGRLAEELRSAGLAPTAASAVFGSPGEAAVGAQHDVVVELGLLDAMAMGGVTPGAARLQELQQAPARFVELLRPGGAWLSVSVVPPSLRGPLLERLLREASAPLASVDNGASAAVHTMRLSEESEAAKPRAAPRLRGGLEPQRVANLLLYGRTEPHLFVYRLRRLEDNEANDSAAAASAEARGSLAAEALERLVAAQRPATREDL